MASANADESPWLEDELWLVHEEQPDEVPDPAPYEDAQQEEQRERVSERRRRFGIVDLLLAVCLFVPQLAWMVLLGYLALSFLS